jgi:osmotically-inducible protein OsmY
VSESMPPPRVEELAECRLREAAHSFARCVSCEYREECLILRGQVPTYYLKQVAQTAVARIPGVQKVDNQIEVCVRQSE